MKAKLLFASGVAAALLVNGGQVIAEGEISSFLFADNIRSSGRGAIDLFKPKNSREQVVTGAVLEAFRQDNAGQLVFAVDVNEASSGSEFSDSQGVAIETAVLTVVIGGETYRYTTFSTPTRSLLAKDGSTERHEHYTLIGTAGTNRISNDVNSEVAGSSLDETLYFDITQDLTLATQARLDVTLLTTNVSLGDPEAFYDFSNGFEEVALLTYQDVRYLEALAPGRDLAPLVISDDTAEPYSWSYYPSSQTYYVVSYEDLYPARGDYDFNDLVVAYQVSLGLGSNGDVAVIRGNGYLVARGAMYDHDWHLKIGLPEWATGTATVSLYDTGAHAPLEGYPVTDSVMGSADLKLVEHVAAIYSDGESTFVNTFDDQALQPGPKFDFQVELDVPVAVDLIESAPYDPYLYVYDTGYEIHLIGKTPTLAYSRNSLEGLTSFRDEAGFPFAIVAPENWQPPLAGIDMGLAYPTFMEFVQSRGASHTQWYGQPEVEKIKPVTPEIWRW